MIQANIEKSFYQHENHALLFKAEYERGIDSGIMWGIYYLTHPDSEYAALDTASAKAIIKQDIVGTKTKAARDFTFDMPLYEDIILKMQNFFLPKPKKLLRNWEKKLEERDDFIASQPYNQDTFEMLDKMMSASSRMWDQYLKVQRAVDNEGTEEIYGDGELSLSEKNLI